MKPWFFLILLISSPVLAAEVEVFTSPDSSYDALKQFLDESQSIQIAIYTFNNPYILDLLIAEKREGKNITITLEQGPVGGANKEIICELLKNNIPVYLVSTFTYHHEKYIITEDKILISTENLDDSYSKNKQGNRGFGVIIDDQKIREDLKKIYDEDFGKSKKASCSLSDYILERKPVGGEYISNFAAKTYPDQQAEKIVVAPGASGDVIDFLNSAESSIYIAEFYINDWSSRKNPFLEAAINKSRSGIEVKILLDSYWYNIGKEGENDDIVDYVNNISEEENLNLKAKLVDLKSLGYEKIHGKLMIVDNSSFLLSSINWNENSPTNNREIGVVIKGNSAQYFADIFDYDWNYKPQEKTSSTETPTGQATENQQSNIVMIAIIILVIIIIALVILFYFKKR